MTKPPPLPREHGAWVMLALPFLCGLALSGVRSTAAWLLPPAAVLAFLAHYALVPWIQRRRSGRETPEEWLRRRVGWGAAYLAGAGAAFAAAVGSTPSASRPTLLAIAAVSALIAATYALAASFGSGREIWSEIVGMIGMALVAPMMAVASGHRVDRAAIGAVAICLGYSLSSLAFVRSYGLLGSSRRRGTVLCLLAHAAIAAVLLLVAFAGGVPRGIWIPFVPVILRTLWGLSRPPDNLRALGLRELWVAVSVAVLAVLVLRN